MYMHLLPKPVHACALLCDVTQVEADLTFCGLLLLECPLKPHAKRVRSHSHQPTIDHRIYYHQLRDCFITTLCGRWSGVSESLRTRCVRGEHQSQEYDVMCTVGCGLCSAFSFEVISCAQVVMITGDNVLTAASVASSLRIVKKVTKVAILGTCLILILQVLADF